MTRIITNNIWFKINHEQEKFIGDNFDFVDRTGDTEFFSNEGDNTLYELSKDPNEKWLVGFSVRKNSNYSKSIAMIYMVFDKDLNKKMIKERKPGIVLERIMRHHPHKNIYERELKLKHKDKLEKELETKEKIKPRRLKI